MELLAIGAQAEISNVNIISEKGIVLWRRSLIFICPPLEEIAIYSSKRMIVDSGSKYQ